MHYPQSQRDALHHLSELPYFDDPSYLGFVPELLSAGAALFGGPGADTSMSPGMPGSNQSVPRQPSALSTVSTSVATQVSPQISPVMTQQQSSPGATVGANPMQYMPGGLSAENAVTPYGNFGMPGFPTNQAGLSPMEPFTLDPMTGRYVPVSGAGQAPGAYSPVSVGQAGMTEIPWIPIAIVGGVVALSLLLPKRRRKPS